MVIADSYASFQQLIAY